MTSPRSPLIPAVLGVSLLLNGMLVVQLARNGNGMWKSALTSTDGKLETEVSIENTAPAALSEAKPAAFHWQQLDAPDFVTYVANLRNIGCPEATIRDIIDGELREIYAHKTRDENGAEGTASASVRWTPEMEVERLDILSNLLSEASSPGRSTKAADASLGIAENARGLEAQTVTAASAASASQPTAIDMVPAAFRVGNQDGSETPVSELVVEVTDSRMDPETAGQISRMRQDFAQALTEGSRAADPTSQEYIKQWMRAKKDSDDRFSSMYGGDAMDALYRKSMLDTGKATAQAPVR